MDPRNWKQEFHHAHNAVEQWLGCQQEIPAHTFVYPILCEDGNNVAIAARPRIWRSEYLKLNEYCSCVVVSIGSEFGGSPIELDIYIPPGFSGAFPHYKRRLYATLKFLIFSARISSLSTFSSSFLLDLSDGPSLDQDQSTVLNCAIAIASDQNLKYLCYCSPRMLVDDKTVNLIPDPHFLLSYGYSYLKDQVAASAVITSQSGGSRVVKPDVYWRGSLNGRASSHQLTDRYKICAYLAGKTNYDVKLTGQAFITSIAKSNEFNRTSIFSKSEPFLANAAHRVVLDIDGNTSSWTGLFGKMLLGCIIVKFIGQCDYVQWYYGYPGFDQCLYVVSSLDELRVSCERVLHLEQSDYVNLRRDIGAKAMVFSHQISYFTEACRLGGLFG